MRSLTGSNCLQRRIDLQGSPSVKRGHTVCDQSQLRQDSKTKHSVKTACRIRFVRTFIRAFGTGGGGRERGREREHSFIPY